MARAPVARANKRGRGAAASPSTPAAAAATAAAARKKQKQAPVPVDVTDDDDEIVASSDSESSSSDGATEQTASDDDEEDMVAATDESDVETNDETVSAPDNDDDNDSGEVESDAPAPAPKAKPRASKPAARAKPAPAPPKKTVASRAKPTATVTKAKLAPKKNSRATATTKKAPPKKRRIRSDDDKLAENAPMSAPLFVEDGSEWVNNDVDLSDLETLRTALLDPIDNRLLEDVFTKLLLKKSERDCLSAGIGLKYEWWNKQLRQYYQALYDKWYALLRKAGEAVPTSFSDDSDSDEDDAMDVELSDDEWLALEILKTRLEGLGKECPLKHQSFAELSVELRCKILHNLCEAVIDDPKNTDHVRVMEEDDMRIEPLGRDRVGNLFYFFPQFYAERRLYRLESKTCAWQLWAKGDASFRQTLAAMRALRGRKAAGEQELVAHLEVIVEQFDDEAAAAEREAERATKRAILEAIPRKRSMRIQVKQIEQMEAQRADVEVKQQLSIEEIADLKRAELLRKVEFEAAREEREKEKEAERLAQEQRDRDAAAAERELRRLRRIEKELEDEAEQQRLEIERQREREARELRVKQREAAEEAARVQEEINAMES